MEHLENHPHAFLDENNIVKSVLLFDGHEANLLDQVRQSIGLYQHISCCDFGVAYVDGDFYNNKFYPAKPYPEWIRDEESGTWIAPEGWVEPAIVQE